MKSLLVTCFLQLIVFSQSIPIDSLKGKVKRTKEKVEFLTDKEFYKFMEGDDDYGHSFIITPLSARYIFQDAWYSTNFTRYINLERFFSKNGNVEKEVLYNKEDKFKQQHIYLYDYEGRVISEIDSSKYSTYTTNNYYSDYGDVSTIKFDDEYNFFNHTWKKYNNKKLIREKRFTDEGLVHEYIYKRDSLGKLRKRIYKNPNKHKKTGERSWTYSNHDSIGIVYVDQEYEYDNENRLISIKRYELEIGDEEDNVIEMNYFKKIEYDNNLKISYKVPYPYSGEGVKYYRVIEKDDSKRIIGEYCCSRNLKDSKRYKKYTYQGYYLMQTEYMNQDNSTKENKIQIIKFKYKFDDNNNWVEIIKNIDGVDLYKWKREIEYYD